MAHIDPTEIERAEDPIKVLAARVVDAIMDIPDYIGACNRLVFREMGLHPQTLLGGDETDKMDMLRHWMAEQDYTLYDLVEMSDKDKKELIPDFITEEDPRYTLYFELLAQVNHHVFAEMVAGNKFRWKPKHAAKPCVMGESNR